MTREREERDQRDEPEDDPEEGAEEAAEPRDHREPLSQREVFELFRYDPAVRPYLFSALGALAMIFLVMFLGDNSRPGSDIGAVVLVLFGLATLAFRWTMAPPFFLFVLVYFLLFPFGLPDPDLYNDPFRIRESHFRVTDVVLVLAVLVYLRCQYRIFGLIQQAMPFENVFRRKGDHPLRRPTSHIDPVEIAWLIGIAVVLVAIGQVVWWLVNALEFAPGDDFPFRWADQNSLARFRRSRREPGEYTPGGNRFFVVTGALFFGFLVLRLVFGYWRMRVMNPAEGAMILTDTSWSESHRERVRVEKWRSWSLQKAKDAHRKALHEQRERRQKEREERERAEARARQRERERERAHRDEDDDDDDRPRRRRGRGE
jgi:hypothetical protein